MIGLGSDKKIGINGNTTAIKGNKNLITILPGSNEITFNEELCKVSIRWTESNLSRKL